MHQQIGVDGNVILRAFSGLRIKMTQVFLHRCLYGLFGKKGSSQSMNLSISTLHPVANTRTGSD